MSESNYHTLVIGAGISGLALARGLSDRGYGVKLLEHSERVGGNVRTLQREGFLVDAGPNALQVNEPAMMEALERTGLKDPALVANSKAAKRYIVRGGRLRAVPASPLSAVSSPLFSMRGKAGLLLEPFMRKGQSEDESLGDFVRRRLNQEFLDYAINPMVGGIYAGDPEVLSVRYGFPKVYALERNHGSLIRGALARLRERRRAGTAFRTTLLSWPDGMETMARELAVSLDVELRAEVQQVEKSDRHWQVTWKSPGGEQTACAERLVLAVPAHALAGLPLPDNLAEALRPLREIAYPPLALVALGFAREAVRHPLDGFGMLVPQKERLNILGTLFSSTLFAGRAPEGHVLLTSFVGGARQPRLARLKPPELCKLVESDLNRLLDLEGKPVFSETVLWERSIPQYTVGYGKFLKRIREVEATIPGLYLLGNYRGGIALGKCMVNGWNLAEAIARHESPQGEGE